jgi:hypothetical protein
MYRIRRESGEEVTFGSVDEFGAAVAAGVVTAKAEIFHARAEKWLPIASHPHFKLAHDRVAGAAAPKPPTRTPGLTASGQRPALGVSGQHPAVGASGQRSATTTPQASAPGAPATASTTAPRAPQLRAVRPEATSAAAPTLPADSSVANKPSPRWNSAQRPASRAVAPMPSAPATPPSSDLRLVRKDALLSSAATAPVLPEFELLPPPEPAIIEPVAASPVVAQPVTSGPVVVEPVAAAPAVVEPVAVEPVITEAVTVEPTVETVVERSPAAVELVSHEEKPAAARGDVEIINPDRTMPVVSDREIPALEIPAPIRDFAPDDAAAEPVASSRSKTPLFVGLGLVAALAAVIGFFVLKPSGAAPTAPGKRAASPAQVEATSAPVGAQPAPSSPGATVTKPPTGASTGLGGDVQPRKPRKQSDGAETASKATIGDGLEPPPEAVLPAAPKLGKIGDAAALPTVEPGTTLKMQDRANALERQRRLIDSSMRSQEDSK